MNGIKNPGFQNVAPNTGLTNKKISNPGFNKGANFQAALGNAKRRDFGDNKHQNPVLAPSPASAPAAPSTNNTTTDSHSTSTSTNTSSGIGAPGNGLRGHVLGARSGNANQEKVEQELENELLQSGLQAQVLKSNPPTNQESD